MCQCGDQIQDWIVSGKTKKEPICDEKEANMDRGTRKVCILQIKKSQSLDVTNESSCSQSNTTKYLI